MLNTLLKIKLKSLFSKNLVKAGKKNRLMKGTFIFLLGYAVVCFFGLFGALFSKIIMPLHEQNSLWLYFGISGSLSFILMFVGSVFTTQSQLYEAKDNELLLSMPISPRYILASRLLTLLGLNLFWGALILFPAEFIYLLNMPFNILQLGSFFVLFILLALFSLSISCIFGWLIVLISNRFRNKSIISTVFSLAFFVGYFYFFNNSDEYINKVIDNGAELANTIRTNFLPMFWLGEAISGPDLKCLLIVTSFILAFCSMIYIVLSKSFIGITTTKRGFKKIKYKEKTLKVSTKGVALLKKELAHFTSSSMYMLNTALGTFVTLIGAVALIINKDLVNLITKDTPEIIQYINPLAVAALCFIASTNIISAPSISLEGKNIWIPQALPVRGRDILMAKANMHIIVCLPVIIFAAIVLSCILQMPAFMKVMLFVLPILTVIFSALFGIVVNLHFPRLDWMSETVAVKQSMSTMIAMFGSFGIVILLAAAYVFLEGIIAVEIYMSTIVGLLGIMCWGMYRHLGGKGEKIFMNL